MTQAFTVNVPIDKPDSIQREGKSREYWTGRNEYRQLASSQPAGAK